jgi:hypothetical protein
MQLGFKIIGGKGIKNLLTMYHPQKNVYKYAFKP